MENEIVPDFLRQVWTWKEHVGRELAEMTARQRADYLAEGLAEFEKQTGLQLPLAGKLARPIDKRP